jgi:hypothetical protein
LLKWKNVKNDHLSSLIKTVFPVNDTFQNINIDNVIIRFKRSNWRGPNAFFMYSESCLMWSLCGWAKLITLTNDCRIQIYCILILLTKIYLGHGQFDHIKQLTLYYYYCYHLVNITSLTMHPSQVITLKGFQCLKKVNIYFKFPLV